MGSSAHSTAPEAVERRKAKQEERWKKQEERRRNRDVWTGLRMATDAELMAECKKRGISCRAKLKKREGSDG